MTRENKLALIIGFSVILVVGVLVSDHFSKARQDQLREISDQEIGSVGVDRSKAFTPIEPLVSDEVTPIAAPVAIGSASSPSTIAPAPWHAPKPGGGGLLGGALDAQTGSSARPSAHQTPQARELATVHTPQRRAPDAPVHIQQGQADASEPVIAMRDKRPGEIQRLVDRGTLIPLARPATLATAAPRAVSQPLPPAPETWEYHVRKNDSLYSIAQELLGSGRRYVEILELNRDRLPDASMLRIGLRLRMPPDAKRPDAIEASPPRVVREPREKPRHGVSTYTVEPGDTLGQISQRLLGTVRRMDEILKLNADQISDADEIRVGMTLKIPAS